MTTNSVLTSSERTALIKSARDAMLNAYAPYSQLKVGAAVLTVDGNIYTGCNVENTSYSLTMCAERVAIFSAIAKRGKGNVKIRAIAVMNDRNIPCSPCGACRQVITEMCDPSSIVLFQGSEGIEQMTVLALLPRPFTSL